MPTCCVPRARSHLTQIFSKLRGPNNTIYSTLSPASCHLLTPFVRPRSSRSNSLSHVKILKPSLLLIEMISRTEARASSTVSQSVAVTKSTNHSIRSIHGRRRRARRSIHTVVAHTSFTSPPQLSIYKTTPTLLGPSLKTRHYSLSPS